MPNIVTLRKLLGRIAQFKTRVHIDVTWTGKEFDYIVPTKNITATEIDAAATSAYSEQIYSRAGTDLNGIGGMLETLSNKPSEEKLLIDWDGKTFYWTWLRKNISAEEYIPRQVS